MRKLTTVLLVIVALTVQIMTDEAHAVLKKSPNDATFINPGGDVVTIKGLPAWFQGDDGVAVQPCLDFAKCGLGLPGIPFFNPSLPISYPDNFPGEAFYFDATNADIIVGTAHSLVVMALEFTFVDPLTLLPLAPSSPGAVVDVFQRLRLVHTFAGGGGTITPTPPANSSFTVETPWGITTFPLASAKCAKSGVDTKCTMTRDISPVRPAADFIPPDSGMTTFLGDPAAPAGFLGTATVATSYTGAPPGHNNRIRVIDPLGQSGTTTLLTSLLGQTIGMDVHPSVLNLGKVIVSATSAATTVTVTNTTGNTIKFPVLVTAGTNAGDFTLTSPSAVVVAGVGGCSDATLAPLGSCSFDVAFAPQVGPSAARSATIALAPVNSPLVVGALDPPPVTVTLSGTAQYVLTGAVASTVTAPVNNGTGTIASSPTGIAACGVTSGTCSAAFDIGTVVTMSSTAAATPASQFEGWSGACSGSGACTVTMDAAKSVSADFIELHNVLTNATPSGGGTITPSLVTKHGSSPTLTITPTSTATARFRLGSLTDNSTPVTPDAVAGTGSFTYSIPAIVANHTVVANFIQQYILTPNVSGTGGAITPSTVQTLDSGTSQNFTITPDPGYRIGNVLVDGVAQTVPATATTYTVPFASVSGDHTVSASFVKIWNVASGVAGSGNVDKTGTQVVDQGTTPSYTFTPSSKKFQVGKILLDNVAQTFTKPATISGPVTYTLPAVTADKSVSAVFVPSGDIDANGLLNVGDALKALKIFVNLQVPDSTDLAAMKIGLLDAAGIPSGGSGNPDLNDIVLILKRAVGIVSW